MKPEKQLYQWDVNQYMAGINPAAQFVDYPIGDEVIRIKADGTRCRIPDEVLQTYGGKTCYERYPDGTFRAYSFSVLYAPKPPDYVYTTEERTTFEALTARVDAAIEDIKRRADSGEFTPKKGVDYFTDAEKTELMEGVSSGAVGEFRKVVDTATAEYNDNHNLQLAKYNANASEKLTTYDTNAEQQTMDYNRNAAEKLEAYNQNHAAKVAEYDANAETKTAEFDANAAALQTEVDRLRGECDTLAAEKANVDGYYEEMTVGDAEQLISTQFVEDNKPYLFRPTGGSSDVGNRAYLDKIVGGTVVWNQLFKTLISKNWRVESGVTVSEWGDNSVTYTTSIVNNGITSKSNPTLSVGHKYLLRALVKANGACKVTFGYQSDSAVYAHVNFTSATTSYEEYSYIKNCTDSSSTAVYIYNNTTGIESSIKNLVLIDLTQMLGSTVADYVYSIEQSQAGAGVAWFKKLFPKDYYEYNAGELLSVEGLQSHDTVGFNQWDEEWEVGIIDWNGQNDNDNTRIRCKNYIPCIDNATYYVATPAKVQLMYYDENKNFIGYHKYSRQNQTFKPMSGSHYMRFYLYGQSGVDYGTTYNHDICINLSDPSRNGEYEPYEKHSYPLDSSLTLRGIPKLDASNNLYYAGDEYASDGTVTRKYGVVDLGTLDWRKTNFGVTDYIIFYGNITDRKSYSKNILQNKYNLSSEPPNGGQFPNNTLNSTANASYIYVRNDSYTDATAFKEAMSGVMLYYELATPTTETAEPFQHIQIVDDFGTEEFVSTGMVPVGHKTRYPANLRDKLQHLPDLASMDGTYLIKQTGKQMSLIHMPAVFPETPTEDGTYTLKTVVTGGVATLQWVAE